MREGEERGRAEERGVKGKGRREEEGEGRRSKCIRKYVPGVLSSMKMVALDSLATPTLGDSTTVNCSILSRTLSSSTVILMSRSLSLG